MTTGAGGLVNVGDTPLPVVETAASAIAAREKAAVEARHIVALKRPREIDEVRVRLLKECERPGFAEVSKYEKPVGGEKIVGLSVRFAEAAIRLMTNIAVNVLVTFDDPQRRVVRVEVVDLETNTAYGQDIPIEKTVERRKVANDREVIGQRTNTTGQTVYIVAATEDEFMNKQNAAISKVLRNHGLRLIPGDILDECSKKIDQTYSNKAAKDPEGEKKSVIDGFASVGVMPAALAAYLEHPIDVLVPAELTTLRRLYQSIRDGETTWVAIMEEKFGDAGAAAAGETSGGRPRPQRKATAATASTEPAAPATPPAETQPVNPEPPPAAAAAPASNVRELDGGSKIVKLGEIKKPVTEPAAIDFKKISELYALMPQYNRVKGQGAGMAFVEEKYGTRSPTDLTSAQLDELMDLLRDGIETS